MRTARGLRPARLRRYPRAARKGRVRAAVRRGRSGHLTAEVCAAVLTARLLVGDHPSSPAATLAARAPAATIASALPAGRAALQWRAMQMHEVLHTTAAKAKGVNGRRAATVWVQRAPFRAATGSEGGTLSAAASKRWKRAARSTSEY